MRSVFANTGYWIALFDPHDTLNPKAVECSKILTNTNIHTSEMVLTEFLGSAIQVIVCYYKIITNDTLGCQRSPCH